MSIICRHVIFIGPYNLVRLWRLDIRLYNWLLNLFPPMNTWRLDSRFYHWLLNLFSPMNKWLGVRADNNWIHLRGRTVRFNLSQELPVPGGQPARPMNLDHILIKRFDLHYGTSDIPS